MDKFGLIVVFVFFNACCGYLPKVDLPNITNVIDKIVPDVVADNIHKIIPDVVADNLPDIPNPLELLYFNRCISDLGCFYTGPPFYHPTARPISLPPQEPNARFLLYCPNNRDEPYELEIDIESLQNSTFDANLPTKLIIHGFRSDVELGDVRHEIKDALLKDGLYNVIIVDWTADNGFPYAQAASNIRTNGAKTAKLLHFLMNNTGITAESIHIIGHSLGAHMAGYIGERVPNLGRITAMDPAGPFFQELDPEVRLDTTDALFIDVIHSDGGEFVLNGLGTSGPIGHIDFYPNGGRRQPGCFYAAEENDTLGGAINFTTKWLSNGCDHNKANEFLLESIDNTQCKFLAVECTSYLDFEQGVCPPGNSTVAEMGFHVSPTVNLSVPAKFFLRTNSSAPYCIEDSIYL